MSVRSIELFESEVLHKPTRKVEFPLTEETKQVIVDLYDTLEARKTATGLAAPQIGVDLSMFVYKIGNYIKPTIMINPSIVKARDIESTGDLEMCLSFPERIYVVPRYKKISVYFQDETGESYVLKYRNFEARVIQHEIDHLSGLTIEDKGYMLDEDVTNQLLDMAREENENGEEEQEDLQ